MKKIVGKFPGNIWMYGILTVIVVTAFIIRFYQLGLIPRGLTNDEADILYDAYSLLLTGKDQWGHGVGIVLQGFGDYRLALYTYLVIPFVKVFGLTSLAVRLPSALAGVGIIPFAYLIIRKWAGRVAGIFAAFLFAINPWLVGLSRIGIESNVALLFLTIGLACWAYRDWNKKLLIASSIFFALCIYTYTSYTFFIPALLLIMIGFHWKNLLKDKKTGFLALFVFVLALMPFCISSKSTSGTRLSQVGIFTNISSIGVLDILNNQRGACQQTFPVIVCKVFVSKPIAFTEVLVSNYISHFSFTYLYREGNPTQYSILPQEGLFYLFELLLFFIGIVYIFAKRIREGIIIVLLLFIAPIPDTLTGIGHYSRASVMVPFFLFIESIGGMYISIFLVKIKHTYVKLLVLLVGMATVSFSLVLFLVNYFAYFSYYYAFYSEYGYQNLMQDIAKNEKAYDSIYVSRFLHDTKQYIYYLVYTHYDPKKFQSQKDIAYTIGTGGWISVNRIGKVYFVDSLPHALYQKHILYVADPKEFAKNIIPSSIIKDPLGGSLFYLVDSKTQYIFPKEEESL